MKADKKVEEVDDDSCCCGSVCMCVLAFTAFLQPYMMCVWVPCLWVGTTTEQVNEAAERIDLPILAKSEERWLNDREKKPEFHHTIFSQREKVKEKTHSPATTSSKSDKHDAMTSQTTWSSFWVSSSRCTPCCCVRREMVIFFGYLYPSACVFLVLLGRCTSCTTCYWCWCTCTCTFQHLVVVTWCSQNTIFMNAFIS